MAKTRQVSVTSASPTAITAFSYAATSVRVTENRGVAGWPTTDLLILKPSSSDTPVRIPAGNSYTFQKVPPRGYAAGEVVGYVQTVAGTTTLDVDEDSP